MVISPLGVLPHGEALESSECRLIHGSNSKTSSEIAVGIQPYHLPSSAMKYGRQRLISSRQIGRGSPLCGSDDFVTGFKNQTGKFLGFHAVVLSNGFRKLVPGDDGRVRSSFVAFLTWFIDVALH